MSWHHLLNWLPSRAVRRTRGAQTPLPRWRFVQLRLERLEDRVAPTFSLGAAANYAILYEGGNRGLLGISNSFTNTQGTGPGQGGGIGNIGVGGSGFVSLTGNGAINGNVDFSAANTGQFSSNGLLPSGQINFNVSAVTSALNTMNALNATLGVLPGTNIAVNGSMTINASDGTFSASGAGYTNVRVFNISDFTLKAGQTLTINGDANGDSVVLNITDSNGTYNGGIVLTGGLTPDNVIFNFVGGSNLTGGPTVGFNLGAGQTAQGIFLDPNGKISSNPSSIVGRLIGGDSSNFQFNGGGAITAPGLTQPTISTQASAGGPEGSTAVSDTATLSGGFNATGDITFNLEDANNNVLFTSVKPANGNNPVTSDSYTPAEDGTYHWVVSYAGDANNNPISDNGSSSSERVVITEVTPTLTTVATPSTATVGQTVTLSDTATLTGQAASDAGTVTFTLTAPDGSTVYTSAALPETGNFNESTSTTLTLSQLGTYTWHASYNDEGVLTSDTGVNETVTVGRASPTIRTRASAGGPEGSTAVFDTATLSGGFNESGNIIFQLEDAGNHVVFTNTKKANGNSSVTSDSFTPAEDGTYHWVVSFAGDANNNPISDNGSNSGERVVITEVTPTLSTSASPTSANAGATLTLSDTATLAGQASGDVGTVTFTLTAPDGSTVYTSAALPETGNFTQSTSTTQTLTQVGPYVWHAIYSDEGNITDDTGVNETVTVGQTTLALSTQASAGGPEGSTAVFDTATLSGGNNETGNIVFNLEDASNNVVFQSTKPANGNSSVTSDSFTPTEDGTYHWVVSYSGDTNNNPISDFTSPAEEVTITEVTPTLTTSATPSTATVGQTVTLSDKATLTGQASGDTGTVTFTLTAPDGSIVYTSPALPETGDFAQNTSTTLTLTQVGTYTWQASYDDEGNVTTDDGVNETVTVGMASPQLSTQASAGGPEQVAAVFDTATLSGGFNPTGDITFNLEDANNNVLFTSVKPANGNNPVTSDSYTPAEDGTYHWVVSYSGDSNNNPISDNGSSSSEQVVITEITPTLTTLATPSTATVGQPVTLGDTAILTGQGPGGAGTVTFTLTAPDSSIVYTSPALPLAIGANQSTSTTLTLSQVGTYTWHAVYNDEGFLTPDTGVNETVTVGKTSPTLATTPTVTTVTLGTTTPPVLTDTATLSGGFNPTGAITFELFRGSTLVDTELVAVSGNGSYVTPTGFTLPTTGTAAGGYVWVAIYSGDSNNNNAAESNPVEELVTVNPASPTLVTTASPITVALPVPGGTLTDSADLEGGYSPTGSIVFTLTGPGSFSYTQTDTVTGNGPYTATLPTALTLAGTYTWTATYEGNANNTGANDQGGAAEQTMVTKASLSLVTIASPNVTLPAGPPETVTLTDSAFLSGGQSPTGSIVFTLTGPGGFKFTQTDNVTGNNTYTAGVTLPTTGTVAGTYTWTVAYSGDANNNSANDQGGIAEQTVVSPASPTLVTAASPNVTLPTGPPGTVKLTDTADLFFGYYTTGNIVFTLTGPGGFSFTQTDTVQSGVDMYTASTTLPTTGTVAGTYTWTAHYSGDGNNDAANDQGGIAEQTVVSPASPTLATTPNVTTVTLGDKAPPVLTDTASLSGGYYPTGAITFELFQGGTLVDTETVAVHGNGSYVTPTGFTLPTTGTAAGGYVWVAIYSGDSNNNNAAESNPVEELVTVNPASPTLVTTAIPTTVTLPAPVPTFLTDTATLSGGYHPTGAIVFTLTGPGGNLFTQTDTVNGNGTYTASTTLPTTGTVVGTYTWTALYEGDANNTGATDQGGAAEQTVVTKASLSLVTIASPNVTLPAGPPGTLTLIDSAFLSGGQAPTGSIVFTLTGPGGFTFKKTDTVTGNGTYTAGVTLPTTGTVAGTYTWTAQYSGDDNNAAASDQGGIAEQTVVSAAKPTFVTIASPLTVTLPFTSPPTLTDTADLADGYFPTGRIVFNLTGPGGFTFKHTDTVAGNGTYTASTTLPTMGTVAGTYTWTVTYSGDADNAATNDQGGITEQTVVRPAGPALTTIPDPTEAVRGATLQDSADLTGGFDPTGDILFSLYAPGVSPTVGPPVYTETVAVNGDGIYHTTVGFASNTGGIWHWAATYSGDSNNNSVSSGPVDEPVTIHPLADLAIAKTASNPTPSVGDTITYIVTASDNGPDDATGVIVTDPLPAGLTFVSDTASEGSYNPATGVWAIGVMAVNTSQTLLIEATVVSPASQTNTARISGDQFDTNLSNNSASVTESPQQADVSVTKQVNLTTPIFGTPVTYTLFVHNNGPGTATGVVASDTLPAGLVFIAATASQGSFDPGSGQWSIGTLPAGATATLQITGLVATVGPITNTASVAALEADPDLANNVSSVTIDGMLSASQVSKSLFLSSSDSPDAATLAAEEAIFNAWLPMWVKTWDALLSLAQSVLASLNGPGNGGVPVFEGNWLDSPLVVYENPFEGKVTAVQVGAFDLLFEKNTVAGLRLS